MSEQPHIARRMQGIAPFHVMAILARARELEAQGRNIIHMEIGEPDFPTPAPIIDAGIQALKSGYTHYTPALGLPALREAISADYRQRHGVVVPADRIAVTPGASGALQLALGVLLNPGEHVLMADPGYPCNRHFARMFGGDALSVPVGAETHYQLTAELIESHWTPECIAVLLASPSNPTGTIVERAALRNIVSVVAEKGARLLVDEIYHGLVYDADIETALAISDQVFVINSFSKYYGMTGWRAGWLVAPDAYMPEIDRLAQNIFLAASTPAQHAARAAFKQETQAIVEARRLEFQGRRDYLLPALRELGFGIPTNPSGAFYLYADCSRFCADSQQFALELLEQAGVAITPGIDFGIHQAEKHVRFAYTTGMEQLQEGVRRLREFLSR